MTQQTHCGLRPLTKKVNIMSTEHITVGAAVRISNTESAPDLLRYLSLDDKYEIIDGTGQLVQVLTNHRFKRLFVGFPCRTFERYDLALLYARSDYVPFRFGWHVYCEQSSTWHRVLGYSEDGNTTFVTWPGGKTCWLPTYQLSLVSNIIDARAAV